MKSKKADLKKNRPLLNSTSSFFHYVFVFVPCLLDVLPKSKLIWLIVLVFLNCDILGKINNISISWKKNVDYSQNTSLSAKNSTVKPLSKRLGQQSMYIFSNTANQCFWQRESGVVPFCGKKMSKSLYHFFLGKKSQKAMSTCFVSELHAACEKIFGGKSLKMTMFWPEPKKFGKKCLEVSKKL